MSLISGIISDLKKAGTDVKDFVEKIAGDAPAVVQTVLADAGSIANVVEAFVPGSTAAINTTENVFGLVAQAIEDAGPAASANGLSVSLDKSVVADIQAVIAAAKSYAAKKSAPAPAAPAPASPVATPIAASGAKAWSAPTTPAK